MNETLIRLGDESNFILNYCTPLIKEYCINSGLMTIYSNQKIILILLVLIFLLLIYREFKGKNG